jgi:hypothetical protein
MAKFSLGQFLGLALLGLEAYSEQNQPGSGGPAVFLNPTVTAPILQDVLTIFSANGGTVPTAPTTPAP